MPGSLLSRVRRNDSTRSDRSDVSADSWKSSGKKVSFNRAVRVKKFPRRADALHDDPGDTENKRFWFKVYKKKNPDTDDSLNGTEPLGDSVTFGLEENEIVIKPLPPISPITESPTYQNDHRNVPDMRLSADVGVGTSEDTVQSRQKNDAHRNHVRKIVTKFNDEARIKYYDDEDDVSPSSRKHYGGRSEPPVDYTDSARQGQGRNALSNGVKGVFGVGDFRNQRHEGQTKQLDVWRKNGENMEESFNGYESDDKTPYRTSILLANEFANSTSNNNSSVYNRNQTRDVEDDQLVKLDNQRNLLPLSFWDSGDQLVSDVSRYESTVGRDDEGQKVHKTVEEGSKVWKKETRTVYEQEDAPSHLSERRKVKSHGDLRSRKESPVSHTNNRKLLSNDYLSDRNRNGVTKDRAVQCNRSQGSRSNSSTASTLPNSHRLIRSSQDGSVTAYSDVPSLKVNGSSPREKKHEDTLHQMDSNQTLLGKKSASTLSLNSKSGKVKSSQKSFGFRLKKAFGATLPEEGNNGNTYTPAKDEDGKWYDIDADVVEAGERAKGHHDISEVRLELEDKKNRSEYTKSDTLRKETKGSVVREVDLRKREIFYENTPLRSKTEARAEAGGLCYREAREDYRRGMANSDATGKRVGSTSTLGRSNWINKSRQSPPKVYTVDSKPPRPPTSVNGNSKSNGSTVKILLNGHDVDGVDSATAKRNATRGGLAAAFKARQKAALSRSDSLSGSRHSVSNLGFSSGGSSTVSSDGEASRRRQAQVVYIPSVDNSRSDSDDRRSGLSRTQSLYAISKPQKHPKNILKNGTMRRYPSNRNGSEFPRVEDEETVDTLTPLRSDTAKDEKTSKVNKKGELHRRHSMPKDSKFGWLKWKIKPEDKRELKRNAT